MARRKGLRAPGENAVDEGPAVGGEAPPAKKRALETIDLLTRLTDAADPTSKEVQPIRWCYKPADRWRESYVAVIGSAEYCLTTSGRSLWVIHPGGLHENLSFDQVELDGLYRALDRYMETLHNAAISGLRAHVERELG